MLQSLQNYLNKLEHDGLIHNGYEVKRTKLPRKLKKKYKKEHKYCFDIKLYQSIDSIEYRLEL